MKYLCLLLASDVIFLWFYTLNGLYTYGTKSTIARFPLRGKIQTFFSHITLLICFKLNIVFILEMGEEGEIEWPAVHPSKTQGRVGDSQPRLGVPVDQQ
mgnify:CR=1 FL=1